MSIRRFINVLFVIWFFALVSGCTTMMLKDYDFKYRPVFEKDNENLTIIPGDNSSHRYNETTTINSKDDCFYRLMKGYFKGFKEINGKQYYSYIVPDAFSNSSKYGIEISIPISPDNKSAIIKKLNSLESIGEPIYIYYATNPLGISMGYSFNPVLSKSDTIFDYPTLILFNLKYDNSGAEIRVSKKINIINKDNIDANLIKKLSIICQKTGYTPRLDTEDNSMLAYAKKKDSICEYWEWSDVYISNPYNEPMNSHMIETVRFLGYFATIPIDIITCPVQLVFYLMYKDFHPGTDK